MSIRTTCSIVTGLAAALFTGSALADGVNTILAEWTFETSVPEGPGPHAAEGGIFGGQATGFHASTSAVYSNPVGNGSLESFSSNFWAIGDYYQFTTSTLGYESITVQWDQTRSSTGPAEFVLQWSSDGVNFSNFLDYTVAFINWSSGAYNPDSTFGEILLPTGAADLATLYIRMTATALPGADTGTNRIDNVIVGGTLVPAPGAIALLGFAGLIARRRRRA